MQKKDLWLVAIIGGAVGVLIQPLLLNIRALDYLSAYLPLGVNILRVLVFVLFLVLAPVALGVAAWLGKRWASLYQFAKFAAVGSLNSFLDLGILNLEALLIRRDPQSLSTGMFFVFKSVSFLFATTNSYLWNKFWTFGDRSRSHSQTVAVFFGITAVTYFLNTGVATFLKAQGPLFGIEGNLWAGFIAPVCGILVALFANFFSYKYLVFRQPGEKIAI